MTEPVGLNPDGLRKSATEFEDAASTTQSILNRLQSSSAAEGEPWGADKNGKTFADGDKGYLTNRDSTFNSLSQLVGVLQDNANNLRDTATTFEENEKEESS